MSPATAAAAMAQQSSVRLRAAMDHLLYRLRRWVAVYPMHDADELPKHIVRWLAGPDGEGPQRAILDAIKMTPELWSGAVPTNCCIVHRDTLAKYVGADAAEYMAGYGAMAVEDQAARCRHEADLQKSERN